MRRRPPSPLRRSRGRSAAKTSASRRACGRISPQSDAPRGTTKRPTPQRQTRSRSSTTGRWRRRDAASRGVTVLTFQCSGKVLGLYDETLPHRGGSLSSPERLVPAEYKPSSDRAKLAMQARRATEARVEMSSRILGLDRRVELDRRAGCRRGSQGFAVRDNKRFDRSNMVGPDVRIADRRAVAWISRLPATRCHPSRTDSVDRVGRGFRVCVVASHSEDGVHPRDVARFRGHS